MRKTNLIVVCLFWCNMLTAQTLMNRDSLLQLIPVTKQDTSLVLLYINIGQHYEADSIDVALQYYLKALDLSKKIKYKTGEIKFYSNYTYILNIKGQYDSSLYYNKESLKLATEIKDDYLRTASLGNIAASFMYLTKYDSAIHYQLQALPYLETKGKKQHLMVMLSNLCNLYERLEQYDKAIAYCKKSIAIARQENDSTNIAIGLTNISNPYLNLRQLKSADTVITEALAISKKMSNKYIYLTTLMNKGDWCIKSYNAKAIKQYAEEAIKISKEIGNPESHSIAQRALAIYYLDELNYTEAKKYASAAYKESVELEDIENQAENISLLSDIALAMKKMPEHYRCRIIHDSLETIIDKEKMSKTVEELNVKYETAKKDNQLLTHQAEIKQKRLWNSLLGGGVLATMLISFLGYFNYNNKQKLHKQKINELETEKQLAATEAILKGEEQERSRLAKDLHDGLGGMLSGIKYSFNTMKGNLIMTPDNAQAFERSMDMLDSSIKEMRRVAHNMMPEALITDGLSTAINNFCTDINKSGVINCVYQPMNIDKLQLDSTTSITLYRIVQELINNAIKHAAATQILVQIFNESNKLIINVEDNGKGFNKNIIDNAAGMGWSNIKSRVEFLKGRVDLQTSAGNGTVVSIEVNI